MKLDILTLVIILSFFFFAMELNIFAIDKEVIKEIKITGNRVKESIIRKALVFKEGDILNQEDIEKSKKNLFRLKLFKSLEIKKEWVEESNGIRIIINVEDGWFIAPMPMIMQGGERSLGLMLMEQNIFRNAENIMLMGINQQAGLSGMANINLYNCFSFSFSGLRFSTEEYLYKDGAYNAKQFIKDNEGKFIEDPEEYGEINNQYEKELYQLNLSIGLPLSKKMGCSVSYISNNIKYSNALVSLPADNGKINSLLLSVGFGERDPEEEFLKGDITSGIGRIFGLGMAEIKD
ncbi:MAG: POTRA domain-containing protein, partial [Elusimicrobiota bacterium]